MLPSQILKQSSPADLLLDILVTWPEMRQSAQARRERPPDDPSFTALMQQLRREARSNGLQSE
jgi:hypothetical protein